MLRLWFFNRQSTLLPHSSNLVRFHCGNEDSQADCDSDRQLALRLSSAGLYSYSGNGVLRGTGAADFFCILRDRLDKVICLNFERSLLHLSNF
jgi:hypothetical protein